MPTKVRPEDFSDALNKGADTPFCNIGGCACNTSGLFGLRTSDPVADVCGLPRCFCWSLACAVNLFLAPFMLAINWVRIYVLPCAFATVHLLLAKICCDVVGCGACFPKYRDPYFPANDASVGYNLLDGPPKPCCDFFLCCCAKIVCVCHNPCGDASVPWKRAPEVVGGSGGGRARLFEGRIEADDIRQGALGDCWLLSAIASAAERHPEIIRRLFVTQFVEPCGVYRLRLYDVRRERWATVVIDDRIPVDDAGVTPRFTGANGSELWVVLLEKAFAKLWGSYGYLKGNDGCLALQSFTGNHGVDVWTREYAAAKSVAALFDVIHASLAHGYSVPSLKAPSLLVGAACDRAAHGLVAAHAYSVLDAARPPGGAELLQLRNPWGSGSWTGPYSDGDASWMARAGASLLGRPIARENGKFWMSAEDFVDHFGRCYFVGASTSVSNATMDYHEEYGVCGPCRGCVGGSCAYWCLGGGARLTCAPERRGTLAMLRDAGLDLSAKGWAVSRYKASDAFAGGKHNAAGWAESLITRGSAEGGPARPEERTPVTDLQPRGDEAA